jgi:WD40 repeat protein
MVIRTTCEKFSTSERLHISPDSRTLALLTPQGIAVQPITAGSTRRWLQDGRAAHRAAFSPDSKQMAVLPADAGDTVEIWDVDTGEAHGSLRINFAPLEIAWHPDGKRVLVGGDRGKLEMRTLTSGAGTGVAVEPFPLHGHLGTIVRIMCPPDSAIAITSAWDNSSIVWDLVTGQPLIREERMHLYGHNSTGDRVLAKRYNPSRYSVTTLIPRTGYRTVAWAGEARASHGAWISPDGRLGVVNCESLVAQTEGDCLLWDFARGVEIARVKGVCAQFSADSRTLFTFERYTENRVRRYDVSAETLAHPPGSWGQGMVVYQGRPGEVVNTGVMSPDGRTLIIAATTAVVFLDTRGENPIRSWNAPAHTVSLSEDGKWAVTMRHNAPSILRTAPDGGEVRDCGMNSNVRFSPDSRRMAVATPSVVRIYDLETLRPTCPPIALEAGTGFPPPLEFSPDNRMIAVPWNRTQMRLYDTATGRELATLTPANPASIIGGKALEFSPDGQWLLAARDNGETVAWNLPVIRGELAKLGLNWEDQG